MSASPTPVFLHGYSGDGSALEEFAATCFPDAQPVCIDLPGFGTNPLHSKAAETDPREYIDEIWKTVRQTVPEGKIHLVGHSYGAMLAFALAAEHAENITRVDLFNPGVWPKFVPHTLLFYIGALRLIPGGLQLLTKIMKKQLLVDAVTRSMQNSAWPAKRVEQIKKMRRTESLTYSPQMFSLSLHALRMPRLLKDVHCAVPVRIVHATDDTITRYISCTWLEKRSDVCEIHTTKGGHLGLLAEPKRWAQILYGVVQ